MSRADYIGGEMALPNPRPHPEWQLVIPHTKDMEYGKTIRHEELEGWSGLTREDQRYRSMVNRWKKVMLQEFKRCVVSVKNEGYRILTFEEMGPRAKHVVRLGVRTVGKGVAVLENAPFHLLNDALRRTYIDSGTRLAMARQMMREKLREIPALPGPNGEGPASPRMLKEKPKGS